MTEHIESNGSVRKIDSSGMAGEVGGGDIHCVDGPKYEAMCWCA